VNRSVYEPGLVARETKWNPLPKPGAGRVMLRGEAERGVNLVQFPDPMQSVLYSRLALSGDLNLLDGIPKVIGMYSLFYKEHNDILKAVYASPSVPEGLADFLSVSQINMAGKGTEWTARTSFLPWITAGQRPVFANQEETLTGLVSSQFNPRATVFLPLELQSNVLANEISVPKLSNESIAAQKIGFDIDTSQAALAVVSQCYDKNWKPTIDGKPAILLRANHAFQAVEIPPGSHRVVLTYRDGMFRIGMLVSACSILVVLFSFVRICRQSTGSHSEL
jgi:hypothetical protein